MINIMTLKDSSTDVHLKNTIAVIKNADSKLCILAGCLSSSFTNNNLYIYELSNFIEKTNSSLDILLSNYDENSAKRNSNLLKRLAYYVATEYNERITVRHISRSINFAEDEKKESVFFLLNDKGGYCIDSNYLSEGLRFTPKEGILSKTLSDTFNSLFQQATPINILTLFNPDNNDTIK